MGQYQKNELNYALNQSAYFAELGLSYDSVFGETRIPILIGEPIPNLAAPSEDKDTFYYDFASNQHDFTKITQTSASGKGSFGFGKVKASASRKKFFSSNSYSCYLFGYIRLIHPQYHFDLTKTTLEPNFKSFLEDNQLNTMDNVKRKLGDEVITSVTLCSELIIKAEIESYTEKQKEEIKVSASISGTFGSGGANFSSLLKKIKSSKNIKISVFGDFPNKFIENTTREAVDKFLLDFPKSAKSNFSILQYNSEPISNIPQLLNYNDIVDIEELRKRKVFISAIDNLYEDLWDWREDILYVTSAFNKKEFAQKTINAAKNDYILCNNYINNLEKIVEDAKVHWLTTGNNGNSFNFDLLKSFPNKFPYYQRIMPIVSGPKPIVIPKPKPRREPNHNDHQTDRPGFGGNW